MRHWGEVFRANRDIMVKFWWASIIACKGDDMGVIESRVIIQWKANYWMGKGMRVAKEI